MLAESALTYILHSADIATAAAADKDKIFFIMIILKSFHNNLSLRENRSDRAFEQAPCTQCT